MMGYFLIIYQGLKPEVIYWEFVNTMRKVAILLFLLFELKVAINLSLIVLLLTARIQIKIKPYKNFENNKIEFLSTMGGATLTMGALVYSRHEQHDVLNGFVFLSIAIVNCKFLIEWLILLMQLYQGKNKFAQTTVICLSKIMCKKRPRLEKVEKKDQSKIKSPQKEIQENKSGSGYVKKRVYRKSKSIIKRGKFKKTRSRKKMWKTKSVRPRDFEVDEQEHKNSIIMSSSSYQESQIRFMKKKSEDRTPYQDISPQDHCDSGAIVESKARKVEKNLSENGETPWKKRIM